ncbi:MAG TPA: amidohydrolase family protein [Blastocatellia bacterium]|nr:amidohydrolase family protein [Blastocatellia bacterium]
MGNEYAVKVKQVVTEGGTLSQRQPIFIHVKKGRFETITTDLRCLPPGVVLMDESDKTALPGLIDMHVHLMRGEPGADINLAPLYLGYGVTSVRDVGSDLQGIKQMRSRIESGEIAGPRIFFCGPQLNGKSFRPGMCNLQTADEARAKVKELRNEGVHALKIYDQIGPELARVVIEEARRSNLIVCGHLGKTTASEAIRSGISGIEHLTSLIFELFPEGQRNPFSTNLFRMTAEIDFNGSAVRRISETVASCGIYVDPTLVVYDRIARFTELKSIVPSFRSVPERLSSYWLDRMGKFAGTWGYDDFEVARASFDKLKSWLSSMQRDGVQIIAGTDAPNPFIAPGRALLDEIKLLTEAGLSNAAAISAATSVAASALGRADEIGAIGVGKLADFLLMEGNPLDDISLIDRITAVYKDGIQYDREMLVRKAEELSNSSPV